MSHLKVRRLRLTRLPYGKFTWVITLLQNERSSRLGDSNGHKIAALRQTLENVGTGKWRFHYVVNWKKSKVYTKIYLTDSMDVAMLKLCSSDLLNKIYKIEISGRE